MAHDAFISYSNKDKPVADAVVAGLESEQIRCWIAPRDVMPGVEYGDAIVDAIKSSRVMVVILSANSNRSRHVRMEVERAVHNDVVIVPFRIENVELTGAMELFLSTPHWLDALTPPLKKHIAKLGRTIELFLSEGDTAHLEEQLAEPVPDTVLSAAIRDWRVRLVALVSLGVAVVAAITRMTVPGLPIQAPEVPRASATVALPPTDTPTQPTPTDPVPTHTPTLAPTPTPTFRVIGHWPTSREAHSVYVRNDTAYLANGADGLIILDVSDPSRPQELGTYPLDNARNVVVSGGIAYVTEHGLVTDSRSLSDRLVLIDVRDPASPHLLGEYEPGGRHVHRSLSNLALEGDTVYLTTSDRLMIVDVSTPSEPVSIGEFAWFSNIVSPGVTVTDGIAYVQANRLHVIDVRDPAEPVEVGGFEAGWGSSIVVVNETAFILGWDSGLSIIDVTTPSRPVMTGRYFELVGNPDLLLSGSSSRQTFMRVSITGNVAYVTYHYGVDHGTWTQIVESGIIAVDIDDPANPIRGALHSGSDEISGVFAVGDLVFATHTSRGLAVMSLNQEE